MVNNLYKIYFQIFTFYGIYIVILTKIYTLAGVILNVLVDSGRD